MSQNKVFMNYFKTLLFCGFFSLALSSCVSSAQKQIKELQQTQERLSNESSVSLANISSLKGKVIKYRAEASELQDRSDKFDEDIASLKVAYAQFSDPNNDSAIAVNQELVQKLSQKVSVDQKINQYRSQANGYEAQVVELKTTSQVQATQAAKIINQIKELSSAK
jgi:predicted RNase H-like nuclease (RuvC/YqgF family)